MKLTVDINDDELGRKVFNVLRAYYNNEDTSYCIEKKTSDNLLINEKDDAPAWVEEKTRSPILHEKDFVIFNALKKLKGVILDIGANWGYSVGQIWSMVPDCKIISFEPLIPYTKSLEKIKSISSYGKYDYRMLGLGANNCQLKFMTPCVNGASLSAFTSAAKCLDDSSIQCTADNIISHIKSTNQESSLFEFYLETFHSNVRKLDEVLLEEPDLCADLDIMAVKIDVEGLEYSILQGAEDTLRYHKPLIMLEGGNRYEGLTEYMYSLGYLYFEREGSKLIQVEGVGTAINGFLVHSEKMIPSFF